MTACSSHYSVAGHGNGHGHSNGHVSVGVHGSGKVKNVVGALLVGGMIGHLLTEQANDEEPKDASSKETKTEDELVNPGYYDVIEHTESMFSMGTNRMTIEITKAVNKKDLAIQLLHDKKYYSPWLYLVLRKHEIKADYK